MKSGFLDKLIERLDRVTPDEVQAHFSRLAREKVLLERVFAALQEGVLILDADGRITWLNDAATQLFGLDPDSALGALLPAKVRGLDWERLAGSGGVVSHDLEVFYPEERFLNFYLAPIEGVGEGGETGGHVMLVRDVTRTRQLTEKMIESERLSALTLLAAGVAHELGNPLNSLAIHLQLLDRKLRDRDPALHKELADLLRTSQGEVERLDFIIEQFLGAVRPTEPALVPCNLNTLVRESLEFLGTELADRGISLSFQPQPQLPDMPMDGGQIKQAIYNVVRNAAQAVAPGTGEIHIHTAFDDFAASLTIADNGPGITPTQMARLFTPYHTTKSSGHGLGLLIVRRIAREHGGDISIESGGEGGTTVVLRLPFIRPRMRLLAEPAAGSRDHSHGEQDTVIELTPPPGQTETSKPGPHAR